MVTDKQIMVARSVMIGVILGSVLFILGKVIFGIYSTLKETNVEYQIDIDGRGSGWEYKLYRVETSAHDETDQAILHG